MNRIRRIIGGHLLLNLARAAGLIGVFALCFPLQCWAQTYTITTFAGGGTPYPGNGDGGPATSANIFGLTDVAVDAAGNLYIADGVVRKVSQNGIISTVAGNPNASSLGTGARQRRRRFLRTQLPSMLPAIFTSRRLPLPTTVSARWTFKARLQL